MDEKIITVFSMVLEQSVRVLESFLARSAALHSFIAPRSVGATGPALKSYALKCSYLVAIGVY